MKYRIYGYCVFCQDWKFMEFKDELSVIEYKISHLCQSCQDDMFSEID
jgi:uncharacterized protein YuzB (UPF0349 family)